MEAKKRKRLEKAGWRVGDAADFLALSPEEATIVDIRSRLASALAGARLRLHLTQSELAKRIGSSQSRVAKMEAADQSVSIDLLVRTLASLGTSTPTIGRILADKRRAHQ